MFHYNLRTNNSFLCRTNETIIIENLYKDLLSSLKRAFNSKKNESVLGTELSDISNEVVQLLDKTNQRLPSLKALPGNGISKSLIELRHILPEMRTSDSDLDRWLAIGLAWSHLGRINLQLYALLYPVDPVKKQSIKKQYMAQEVSITYV